MVNNMPFYSISYNTGISMHFMRFLSLIIHIHLATQSGFHNFLISNMNKSRGDQGRDPRKAIVLTTQFATAAPMFDCIYPRFGLKIFVYVISQPINENYNLNYQPSHDIKTFIPQGINVLNLALLPHYVELVCKQHLVLE